MSDKIDLTPWENHDGPPPDFDSPAYPVFDSGVTWTIGQLAVVLNIDCNDFSWDAATEEYDGDVRAVIGNAITAALGEEWSDFRAENERLRELVKSIKRDADEWCISRMTGNPELENQKAERMWKTIRNAAAATAPIEASAALETKKGPGDKAQE